MCVVCIVGSVRSKRSNRPYKVKRTLDLPKTKLTTKLGDYVDASPTPLALKKGYRMTAKRFVKVWVEAAKQGENKAWVARKLSVSKSAVSNRAVGLRKMGVKLPTLGKGRENVDVASLNTLIEELK